MEIIFDLFITMLAIGALCLALCIMGLIVELLPDRWLDKMIEIFSK